mgnify:CR=1 FL=1
MSWFQNTFDPNTAKYNAQVKAANAKKYAKALGKNVSYKNKGVAFRQAKWGAVTDKSVADSNVHAQALQNQYAAFQGFEAFARTRAADSGPSGEGSRTAERGRTANYMALLAKRQDIEHGLRESFGAAYHGQLHRNAVRQQNSMMAARDKLGIRPAQMGLAGMKSTNPLVAAFNVAKTGASIYAGIQTMGAGFAAGGAKGSLDIMKGMSQMGEAPIFQDQSQYYG